MEGSAGAEGGADVEGHAGAGVEGCAATGVQGNVGNNGKQI